MSAVAGVGAVAGIVPPTMGAPAVAPTAGDDTGFAANLTNVVDQVRGLQSEASRLGVAAVTGDLDDIHSAMIASSRAAVTLELVAAVRNKGVDAFNEIMRMQA